MKKIILLFLFIATYSSAIKAQEQASKINSLATELSRLKHGYDYLYCEYKLTTLSLEIKIFANDLRITTNHIISNGYNNNYSDTIYKGLKRNYDEYLKSYESYLSLFQARSFLIPSVIENSSIYEHEINYLKNLAESVEQSLKYVKTALDQQKIILDVYNEIK